MRAPAVAGLCAVVANALLGQAGLQHMRAGYFWQAGQGGGVCYRGETVNSLAASNDGAAVFGALYGDRVRRTAAAGSVYHQGLADAVHAGFKLQGDRCKWLARGIAQAGVFQLG